METFDILGPHSHPSAPIDVKFFAAKRTQVPVSTAKFDLNRCNESPLRGEKPNFWPVSKNNTGSLPLRGILPVTKLETKASSCIPAGCRVTLPRRVLITMSVITMRRIFRKFCVRLFTLCKMQNFHRNFPILWRHLQTDRRNV